MYPSREEAHRLLEEAEACNPGPWGDHSRVSAHCAEKIAIGLGTLDPERAYIQGLLHDIGRKFGKSHLRHIYDGYQYMMSLSFDDVARTCLTHSFHHPEKGLEEYVGKNDCTPEETEFLLKELESLTYDDYDRLIQLCDGISGTEGVVDLEERMKDVKRRYGFYPQSKWDMNLELLHMFGERLGKSVYEVVDKENFRI